MKKLVLFIAILSVYTIYGQNLPVKEVNTKVNEVTVFLRGAQITRYKTVHLNTGKSILKFINLSPFIKDNSMQVQVRGGITVLSVNHQQNFVDKLHKPKEILTYEDKIKALDNKIEKLNASSEVLEEQKSFLKANKDIGGNQTLNVQNISQTLDFYSKKMKEIGLKEIEIDHKISKLIKKRKDLLKQLKSKIGKKDFSRGEILVKVDVARAGDFKFKLSYIVNNAGWFPAYDIRAVSIDKPLKLIYKAKVKQDTKIDWKNVKLSLSSINPDVSSASPKLKPYYLDYYSRPPTYDTFDDTSTISGGQVTGIVVESGTGDPIPGVNVIIKGTNMGAATDFDGKFTILMPQGKHQLEVSAVGYKTQIVNVHSTDLSITLYPKQEQLKQVVVSAVGISADKRYKTGNHRKFDTKDLDDAEAVEEEEEENIPIPFTQQEHQTTVDFKIDMPYTINSDNQVYTVDMVTYKVPANYQYYSVPKIVEKVYLLAQFTDWEKYNLLEGEANIFFEDAFVGKTILDVSKVKDTMTLSLGTDKSISIKRQSIKDLTTRQFIGAKKSQTKAYKIIVKNNKSKPVNIVVYDQVPVPRLKDIKLEVEEISGAKYNENTGEIKWKFTLQPRAKKELLLKYTVKYSKYRQVQLD